MRSAPFQFSTQVFDSRRFYLELNPTTRKRLSVVAGGWEHCYADYDLERSGFPYLIIEFVSRGLGRLTLDGRDHLLQPGSIFIYGPGVRHRIRAEQTLKKYFVAVNGMEAERLLEEYEIAQASFRQIAHPGQIEQVFNDLIAQGLSDHSHRGRMCAVAFQYLVMKIADLSIPQGEGGAASVATYQRCRQYIEDHFRVVRSLQEVAAACYVDSAYLCRLFKRFRRQSPFQYLQHLQMNHAVDLLQSGQRTVKEVAQELGFPDPYNFSRTFKRVFGVAPTKLLTPLRGGRGAIPPPAADT